MGGGAPSGPKPYRSPNIQEVDPLGLELMLGMISGQPVAPSPTLSQLFVAQSLGGTYDKPKNRIKLPDGSYIRFDPLSQSFSGTSEKADKILSNFGNYSRSAGGKPFGSEQEFQAAIMGGQPVFKQTAAGSRGNPEGTWKQQIISPESIAGGASNWVDQANTILTDQVNPMIYGPNSPYRMFGEETFGSKVYNPETGLMESQIKGEEPRQLTGDYYLDKYGSFLDEKYDPYQYQEYKPYEEFAYNPYQNYKQFDYTAPQLQTLDDLSGELLDKAQSRALDDISQSYGAQRKGVEDFIASSGGSLSGGRAARLMQDVAAAQGVASQKATDELQYQNAQRRWYDAQSVRDQNAAMQQRNLELQGGEARYAYDTGRQEATKAQDIAREEKAKSFDIGREEAQRGQEIAREEGTKAFQFGQTQGAQRLGTATAADEAAAGRAQDILQANRQQQLQKIQALGDWFKTYAGLEGTAAQLQAAQASQRSNMLGGLFSSFMQAVPAIGGMFGGGGKG